MLKLLTPDVLGFVLVVVAGAAVLMTHWGIAKRLALDPTLPRILRLLAVFPPFTPLVAFHAGKRAAAMLWTVMVVVYVVIRLRIP